MAGGIYHVYNRVSRGGHVFKDDGEAERLVSLLAETKKRDDFQVLAWCIMANHYHLAVRMGEVSLVRSMRTVHQRFSQSYNGRHRVFGPFWQGRYRSKFVEDAEYLQQLIVYIHLHPVSAGVVANAADYRWGGHGEMIRRGRSERLVDVDETLAAFDPRRKQAAARYRSAMEAGGQVDWHREAPGRLPWWRIGRPPASDREEIKLDAKRPRIGMDGLSNVEPRPKIELDDFLGYGASALGVTLGDLRSRKRRAAVVTAREILAWLAVELYGFQVKEVSGGLEKYLETTSRLVSRASVRRVDEEGFSERLNRVDEAITRSATGASPR